MIFAAIVTTARLEGFAARHIQTAARALLHVFGLRVGAHFRRAATAPAAHGASYNQKRDCRKNEDEDNFAHDRIPREKMGAAWCRPRATIIAAD